MIHFSCPRCLTVLDAPEKDGGSQRICPRCQQRLEVPQVLQSRAVPPPVLPVRVVAAPHPPAAVLTPTLDEEKIDQLNRLQKCTLPGNALVAIGFPTLFVIPLLFMYLPVVILSKDASGSSFLSGCLGFSLLFLWVGGTICLLLMRKRLNADFLRKNTIYLDYSLPQQKDARYRKLLRSLDDLAQTQMFEIVASEHGVYDESSAAILQTTLPRFLDCNYDAYCLGIGKDRYYLLPDCVVASVAGDLFTVPYRKVLLSINNVSGSLRRTVYDHRWVHSRVDGGPDRRYKSNYQVAVPREVTVSLQNYGVISFKIGRDKLIVLTDRASLLLPFDAAFQNWLQVQQ